MLCLGGWEIEVTILFSLRKNKIQKTTRKISLSVDLTSIIHFNYSRYFWEKEGFHRERERAVWCFRGMLKFSCPTHNAFSKATRSTFCAPSYYLVVPWPFGPIQTSYHIFTILFLFVSPAVEALIFLYSCSYVSTSL